MHWRSVHSAHSALRSSVHSVVEKFEHYALCPRWKWRLSMALARQNIGWLLFTLHTISCLYLYFLHPKEQLSHIQYLGWHEKVGVSATLLTELGDCWPNSSTELNATFPLCHCQYGRRLVRAVSIVQALRFPPLLGDHPGTFSALTQLKFSARAPYALKHSARSAQVRGLRHTAWS